MRIVQPCIILHKSIRLLGCVALAAGLTASGCASRKASVPPVPMQAGPWTVTLETEPSPPVSKKTVRFRARLRDARGEPVNGARVDLSLRMAGMDHGPNVVHLVPAGDGSYAGQAILVMGGRWTAELTIDKDAQTARSSQTVEALR